MIKLIIFDLDGVLIDAKEIHYKALNEALLTVGNKYVIDIHEHLSTYDGLKTSEKLDLLTKNKGLPKSFHESIWNKKQQLTAKYLSSILKSDYLINLLSNLTQEGYKLACCSNSIRKTVFLVLSKLGIIHFFDLIVSNEDVTHSKPHPEIYWKTMTNFGFLPEETLIIEDSPVGLLGAGRSSCNVLRVDSPAELTTSRINHKLTTMKQANSVKWKGEKLNVLIPMAGAGSRFETAGYTFPKPLIDVKGKPMIQMVVENLNIEANYIYIVRKAHRTKYNLDLLLNIITPDCEIVDVEELTDGAACTTLLAKNLINNDTPLLLANSDQVVDWNSTEFMYRMIERKLDAGIVTFTSTHPKWSFVKTNELGFVTEVAEKKPISNIATVGIYYWSKGSDYVKYAEQMINKNIRVNNEFYVCPVFNEALLDNKKIQTFSIKKMWGLGTPEDLNIFLNDSNIS